MASGLLGLAALVTGAGRSRGIGAEICRALAEKGANVFFAIAFALSFLLGSPCAVVGFFG